MDGCCTRVRWRCWSGPSEIEQLFRGDNGAIRVYASSTIGNYIMPEIIARYRHDFPDLPVELSVGNSPGRHQRRRRPAGGFRPD